MAADSPKKPTAIAHKSEIKNPIKNQKSNKSEIGNLMPLPHFLFIIHLPAHLDLPPVKGFSIAFQ